MEKTEIFMNKPGSLGLSALELSKILMYEFWYDYVKPKYCKKVKLWYVDTDSLTVSIKRDIYKNDLERRLSKAKNKNVIGLMKDQLGGQIMNRFVRLRAKTYSYLKDNNDEEKKQKAQKSVSQKENLHSKFRFYILDFEF